MKKKEFHNDKISDTEIKKLVIARLETLPSGKKVSIGDKGSFTKDELIERVQAGDSVGEKMIKIELEFLRSMKEIKEGKFFDEPTTDYNPA